MQALPRSFGFAFGLLATLIVSSTPLLAQTAPRAWPQRPVKFIVTLGAGSGVDIGTRLIGDRLSARWGQPVVVENRPGGDGIVAISSFLSAHDDHVLLASPTSSFTAHPYLQGRRSPAHCAGVQYADYHLGSGFAPGRKLRRPGSDGARAARQA